MAKNVQVYNQVGAYIGANVSTGFNFIDTFGVLNNNYSGESGNYNTILPLNRIHQISFGWNFNRTEIKQLGTRPTLARPVLNPPDLNLSISYYQHGLINEYRLGFMVNLPFSTALSTIPLLFGSGRGSFISGLVDRSYELSNDNNLGFPLTTREPKNIYVAIRKDNLDLNTYSSNPPVDNTNIDILAFGDCYIKSYRNSCSVGQIPSVTVDFVANNIEAYGNASGCSSPSINPQNFIIHSGIKFNIPNNFQGTGLPTVIVPGDINISIKNSSGTNPENLSFNFDDMKIQSYEFSMNFNRNDLYNIGYKAPLDRRITFPVMVELNFDMLIGDNKSGSMANLFKHDVDYDINLKLNYQPRQRYSGTAVQYDFLGAKFNNINFNQNISQYKSATLSFTAEINIDNGNKGFFTSGQLGNFTGSSMGNLGNNGGTDFSDIPLPSQILWEDSVSHYGVYNERDRTIWIGDGDGLVHIISTRTNQHIQTIDLSDGLFNAWMINDSKNQQMVAIDQVGDIVFIDSSTFPYQVLNIDPIISDVSPGSPPWQNPCYDRASGFALTHLPANPSKIAIINCNFKLASKIDLAEDELIPNSSATFNDTIGKMVICGPAGGNFPYYFFQPDYVNLTGYILTQSNLTIGNAIYVNYVRELDVLIAEIQNSGTYVINGSTDNVIAGPIADLKFIEAVTYNNSNNKIYFGQTFQAGYLRTLDASNNYVVETAAIIDLGGDSFYGTWYDPFNRAIYSLRASSSDIRIVGPNTI